MPATLALRIEIGRRDASGEADGARLIGVEDAGREPKAARGRTSVRNDARLTIWSSRAGSGRQRLRG
jgi:hypothetical protein